MKYFLKLLLLIIDLRHKKKIISFFKEKLKNKSLIIVDVGAHEGETINLFSKNFNLNKIICYEASSINFNNLKNSMNKDYNFNIEINNTCLCNIKKKIEFFQTSESSSSTFCKINYKSEYFKRKKRILDFFYKKKICN